MNKNEVSTQKYNKIMWYTLKSYTDVLLYEGGTNENLLKDLNRIKTIINDWIENVEIDIEMEGTE